MLLTRLMNAPRALQDGVAVLLGIMCLLLPLFLAAEAAALLRGQSAQIAELRARAGRMAGLAAMKDEALKLAAAPIDTGSGGLLIEAENLPIAKANLQSRISAIAQAHGAAVSSSGGVPDIVENGLLLIGLRADISGTNEAIEGTLSDIESGKPPLLVREFTLRSEGAPLADRPMTLTASIRLYGVVRQAAPAAQNEEPGQALDQGAVPQ
ncbi:MAG: type II secretion system protein GspM [Rhizobiaceae bacterium]